MGDESSTQYRCSLVRLKELVPLIEAVERDQKDKQDGSAS